MVYDSMVRRYSDLCKFSSKQVSHASDFYQELCTEPKAVTARRANAKTAAPRRHTPQTPSALLNAANNNNNIGSARLFDEALRSRIARPAAAPAPAAAATEDLSVSMANMDLDELDEMIFR